ncbi:hypothetical protein NHF48_022890 [Sphingomonas sp. H160509]|uniref:hypothetical protein n=1 Tax=Sphingomonas sp. H160509 TaxID=2955313 RepID=UPI002097F60C|nr:hypothetical protein [Sphingomonas sp. H160509]MDD1453120.1 hypothetical protein [Sphingomonas sp. H160509]
MTLLSCHNALRHGPVLELAEQALDEIAPTVFLAIMRDRYAAVTFGWNDRLDIRPGEFLADGIGVISLIGKQGLDPVSQHPEQWPEALHVVGLARRQDET